MKKVNAISEFSSQRSELLLKNFRESLARQSVIDRMKAFHEASEAPAPRFWVSDTRAAIIISRMMKGDDVLSGMQPGKRKMYLEIYKRVKELRAERPKAPLGDLVFEVVNSPAPCSYLAANTVRNILSMRRVGSR